MRKLRILVVESGARGHALRWKIEQSPLVERVLVAPGNGGIPIRDCRAVLESDHEGLIRLCKAEHVDLVVIGPETPLVGGIVDLLSSEGIRVFGPTAAAAQLEGSKIFAKIMCDRSGILTAPWDFATSLAEAETIISAWKEDQMVLKADRPCGGKGVDVVESREKALAAAYRMMAERVFGDAGRNIVIEDKLAGRECSVHALCDGSEEGVIVLPYSRDHKCLLDGNKGPNTGGMGAYSPLPDMSDALAEQIKRQIVLPTVRAMAERGTPFRGVLYGGLMLTDKGPMLLEWNVRFGDPETQVILPRVEDDIVPYLLAATEPGGLSRLPPITVRREAAVCINLVPEGYPGEHETGFPITGVGEAEAQALVFHAGVERNSDGELITSGSRVMSIVGIGEDIKEAREKATRASDAIRYDGKFRRTDIAEKIAESV